MSFRLLIATIFLSSMSYAQVTFSSVSFSSNPTSCTNTIATVSGSHFCANYLSAGSTFSVSGNTLTINVSYTSQFICLPAIVPYTATVNLGNLNANNYNVTVNTYLDNQLSATGTSSLVVVSCCDATADFTVSPNDSACAGDVLNFTSTSTNQSSQIWFLEGSQYSTALSNSLPFDTAGTFDVSLVVTGTSCTDTATQSIFISDFPDASLGADTMICDGSTATFTAPTGQGTYVWSTGWTGASESLNAIGSLSITITNEVGCASSDTVSVTGLVPNPQPDLGGDIEKCPQDTLTITAPGNWQVVQWFNNDTMPSIDWPFLGTVWVKVSDNNGCIGLDTIEITEYEIDTLEIEHVPNLCGETVLFTSVPYNYYQWSLGAFLDSLPVNQSDTFSVTVTDQNGCQQSDDIIITLLPVPAVDLGPDTNLCGVTSLTLSPGVSGSGYLWSDGSTTPTINVSSPGTYSVSVTNTSGCTGTDAVKVEKCVGIETIADGQILVYPNPSNGFVTIELLNNEYLNSKLEVYSVSGQLIRTESISNQLFQLDLKSVDRGVYFFIISNNKSTKAASIVIE